MQVKFKQANKLNFNQSKITKINNKVIIQAYSRYLNPEIFGNQQYIQVTIHQISEKGNFYIKEENCSWLFSKHRVVWNLSKIEYKIL